MILTALVDDDQFHEWFSSYIETNRNIIIKSKKMDERGNIIVDFDIE